MSSKKAVYESSILCGFGCAADELTDSCLTTAGAAAAGRVGPATDETTGFGFPFWTAVSLLTRTDAGT